MRRFITVTLATAFAIPGLTAQNRQADPPTSNSLKKNAVGIMAKSKMFWDQVGKASWYGSHFQGKETASGEAFDMYDLTAAHRNLPMGSLVRVTNLANGSYVTVRINDRGPVYRSRIIDLSYKAAKVLGLSSAGVQKVRLEMIAAPVEMAAQTGVPSLP
jgi:rare lipoprotein A